MNFSQAQQYLDSLQMHKIKLGLDAMESFLDRVERPDSRLRFVHVAGTNGKGSVSVNIVSVMKQAGYQVGLFTSPHLSSVRERFRIGDQYISEEEFARIATKIREVLGDEMITYFEFTTALALLWFAEADVDLVVLETGLGGRLDATNIVSPLVSIITNVSMDHEAYLGNDLASIAYEKAGIIKANIPLVTGVDDEISRDIVENRCQQLGTPLYLNGREFVTEDEGAEAWKWLGCSGELQGLGYSSLQCGMKGDYQRGNSALAVAAICLLQKHGFTVNEENIRSGLADVLWPGRLEYIELDREPGAFDGDDPDVVVKRRYLIDGAHNPAGVASLQQTLAKEYAFNRLMVIWGAMMDKDLSLTLPVIAAMADIVVLTKPQGERAAEPAMLAEVLSEDIRSRCHLVADVTEALAFAERIASPEDLIVIAGSLYLIGDLRRMLLGELVE